MRYLNLILTITCVAGSAVMAAQGNMVQSLIGGILGLLNFAIWVSLAPDHKNN